MDIPRPSIEKDVRAELAADPRIPYPHEIAVEVFAGVAVLRGTVGSFSQARAAVEDARGVGGVGEVYDELQVRLLDDDRRADAEIRGQALQRLFSDPLVPADWVDVRVRDGWITIKGEVDHHDQSDAAFESVSTLDGITGITNDIDVVERRSPGPRAPAEPPVSDASLQIAIMTALAENRVVHADEVAADVHDGAVILRGTVGALVQKAEAARVTRAVPGVRRVDDRLAVHPMGVEGRANADTEAAVLDALIAHERVHAGDIDVDVQDGGEVTLRGLVEHADQRDVAERIVLAVPGVESVRNELGVLVQVSADEVAERVTNVLGIEGVVGAERIEVRVRDTAVTLTGTVHSREHHDAALAAAARASGVTAVQDELSIEER